LTASC